MTIGYLRLNNLYTHSLPLPQTHTRTHTQFNPFSELNNETDHYSFLNGAGGGGDDGFIEDEGDDVFQTMDLSMKNKLDHLERFRSNLLDASSKMEEKEDGNDDKDDNNTKDYNNGYSNIGGNDGNGHNGGEGEMAKELEMSDMSMNEADNIRV